MYRGRFAPSPTGRLHLGHARTYLVAWLEARAAGGELVLRVEDLDPPRVRHGAAEAMMADLRWLGLDWDEGPDVGGARGPYSQSERFDRYARDLDKLAQLGAIYACTCSRKEIASIASAPHGAEDLGVRYPGTCRSGPSHPDRDAALRFRMPEPPPTFADGLHGQVDVGDWGGDFVVRRADGLWSYQLAVAVDDAQMGITHVVRGDDLISSTPRQIALYQVLGYQVPRFLHVPLVLGPDGQRLAKRHGAVAISDYRDAGVAAATVVGVLAGTLGLGSGAPVRPDELIVDYDVARLPSEPTSLTESLTPSPPESSQS